MGCFLVYFQQSRLDGATKRAWEMSLETDELPTFNQLRSFIERRCRALVGSLRVNQTTVHHRPTPAIETTPHALVNTVALVWSF